METPLATAKRLLVALEELVLDETILIRTRDFSGAVEIRVRANELIEKFCSLASEPSVEALRPRVHALIERCNQNQLFVEEQRAQLQGELDRVNEAHGRLRQFAPVYKGYPGPRPGSESRLNTAA